MKKFKVIEEGRVLTEQALAQVRGGSVICIDPSTYRNCSGGNKTVCNGVVVQPCVRSMITCDGNLKICVAGEKRVCGGMKSIVVIG